MNDFFNAYANAFDSLDPKAIASLYQLPCAISDGDGTQVFSASNALIDKFSSNCYVLRTLGYKETKFTILAEQSLGQSAKAVTLGWQVKLESGEMAFRAHYVCHLQQDHWRIFSVTVFSGSFSGET
jgi:hypothetical protein